MANLDNLRILGFGNPLLDISAVVEQDVLDKCAAWRSTPRAPELRLRVFG